MQVKVAKLGQAVLTATVDSGATAMDALKNVGIDLDSVKSLKRNGVTIEMTTALSANDIIIVSQEKREGAYIPKKKAKADTGIKLLAFEIVKQEEVMADEAVAYDSSLTTFEIVKQYVVNQGRSMNEFVTILDEDGVEVKLSDELVDGESYVIVME